MLHYFDDYVFKFSPNASHRMKIHLWKPVTSILLFSGVFLLIASCATNEPAPEPEELTIEFLITLSDEELMERDSDGDGLSDYDEIYIYGTDPLNPDTDGDGLSDYDEIFLYGTDPLKIDSAGNGFTDGQEIEMGTDPLDPEDPPFIKKEDLHTVHFPFGNSALEEGEKDSLIHNINKLTYAEEFRVLLIISSDENEETANANGTILEQRAQYITHFLSENGIEENRIDIELKSAGSSDCTAGDLDEHNSCISIRSVAFIPINPYPFDPHFD